MRAPMMGKTLPKPHALAPQAAPTHRYFFPPCTIRRSRSRMSSDDAPTNTSNGPGSTLNPFAPMSQYANCDAGSMNFTCCVSPGCKVTRANARKLLIGCTTALCSWCV